MNDRLTPLLLTLSLAAGCGGRYDQGAPIPLARPPQIPEIQMQDLPPTPPAYAQTNTHSSPLNPSSSSDAEARLSQPLLRGFGPETNELGIRLAKLQYQQTQARTKLELTRVLANVDRVYWRLYAARQELL